MATTSLATTSLPKVHLDNLFDGPLDLLLHLIKVNELEITEVKLAEVTNQYLAYLDAMKELDLEIAGEFLVIAATLLAIKSRSLLPATAEEAEESEELDEVMSTRQLIRRLVEFRKFKELAGRLRSLEEENSGYFFRAQVIPIVPTAGAQDVTEDIRTLFDAFARVLRAARMKPTHTVRNEGYRVEDKIVEFRERLRRRESINLTQLFERCICKEEIIVTFLATLELARLREITIAQAGVFEDIFVAPWDEAVAFAQSSAAVAASVSDAAEAGVEIEGPEQLAASSPQAESPRNEESVSTEPVATAEIPAAVAESPAMEAPAAGAGDGSIAVESTADAAPQAPGPHDADDADGTPPPAAPVVTT